MKSIITLIAGLFSCILLINGCSATTLNTSDKNPQFTGKVGKVYIIGFSQDQEIRQRFEDTVSEELNGYGVTGLSSYKDQPVLQDINDDAIAENVRETGADSLLLTVATGHGEISGEDIKTPQAYQYELHRHSRDSTYPQPYYKIYGIRDHVPRSYKPYGNYPKTAFSDFYSFVNTSREVIYEPFDTSPVITIQTYLFDTRSRELLWSAELTTKNNVSGASIADFVETVTVDLKKQGLI